MPIYPHGMAVVETELIHNDFIPGRAQETRRSPAYLMSLVITVCV